jgi:two-component system, chemotaxis family, response regulator Rcp1
MNIGTEVLLVDDNPGDTDLISDVLSKAGGNFRMSAVHDGAEAIAWLRRKGKYADASDPDLIVLDLNMPRMDGREVLLEVKSDPELVRIPVVVFTSSEARSDIDRSYSLGANCYLRKPGNLPDFIAAVQSMGDFWFRVVSLPRKEK